MIQEGTLWRSVGVALGAAVALCAVANSLVEDAVPHEVTLLLLGSLVALGVGSTIADPGTSAIRLSPSEERKFRRRQYAVGFAFSIVLALTMLAREVRESTLVWLFVPIMVLPFILVIRDASGGYGASAVMAQPSIKTPHWSFWIVCSAALIFNAAGCVNFGMQVSGAFPASMPEMHRELLANRPVWATTAFAAAVFGGAAGCILLLLRRRAARYLFVVSFFGATVTMVHTLGLAGYPAGPVQFVIGNLVQLLVTLFMLWYAAVSARRAWVG